MKVKNSMHARTFNYLESIIACMPGSVYWKDRSGIYRGGNDYLAKLAGFKSRKEITGKTDNDFAKIFNWNKKMLEGVIRLDMHVMETGVAKFNHEEQPFKGVDGKYINQLSNKVPLFNRAGKVVGLVGISIDITERKRTEQELKIAKQEAEIANKAKSAFLASMSHDLRTPLQAILMMTEVLQKKSQTPYPHKPLDTISKAGKELIQLVEEVLSFSKLESGKQELRPEIFCLREFLDELNNMMQLTAEAKNISLRIDYSSDIPLQVIQDSMVLRRILMNLLNNAIKFTEQGYVQLAVNVAKIEDDTVWLQFKVSDTGIGIPSDKLESIFERFSRVESGQKKRYEGIGLGLAIVKELVQVLDGEIQVSSELGKGSEFTCLLPFESQAKTSTHGETTFRDLHANENKIPSLHLLDNKVQTYLDNIIARMPGSIYWKDEQGSYLGCNDFVVKMAGVKSRADIIGQTDYQLPWKDYADQLREIDKRVMRTNASMEFEERPILANGVQIIMLTHKTPLLDEHNNVIGIIGISVDITERKRVEAELSVAKEQAVAGNQAKTEFIAGMSHDLRTPLQAILMMAEILQKKSQAPELKKPLDTISKAGNELMQLVEAVLSFSKLESGKQELHSETFNLRQLIEDIAELMEHSAQQKNLQLIIECSAEIPSTVVSDSAAIRRILFNLINNAIKFTEQGRVQLAVSVTKIENDTVWLQFKVSDTGIGIPSDKLETIFERFSRVESGHKKRYEGIGLGLAIVKQLVQALGGEVQVSSEFEKGSEFTCLLPFELRVH